MSETLEERKRRLYSALSHEELVNELMKRDTGDNTSLRDIAKSSINDKIVEVLQQSILERIVDPKFVDEFLLHQTSYGKTEPSKVLVEIFNRVNVESLAKDFQEELCAYLKEHYKEICKELALNVFLNGLCNNNSYLRDAVYKIMEEKES
jgi:predicted glycoside hydrolase/deacetylase ChbG (UPF0249 family)